MPAVFIAFRRCPIATSRCAVLAVLLAGATPSPAQEPGRATACAAPLASPWRCVGALRPANAFEALEAIPSPDGTRFVHVRTEGRNRQLWLLDTRTGAEHRLTHAPGTREEPAWSPDGTLIAFMGEIHGPLGRQSGVGVVDAATGQERLVAAQPTSARIGSVGWTPRGRLLFHVWEMVSISTHGGGPMRQVIPPFVHPGGWWTADADGLNLVRLRVSSGESPAFHPAGDSLAFIGRSCSWPGEAAVWIVHATEGGEGRCIHALPDRGFWWGRLAWPHADTLLYLGSLGPDSAVHVYLLPVDGTPPRRLDVGDGAVSGMGVTRGGGVSVSLYRQRARIALLPAAGRTPVPLPPDVPDGAWPEWLPSGTEVTFTAVPSRPGWDLHQASLVRAPAGPAGAGAQPVRLAYRDGGPSLGPPSRTTHVAGTWSPDGRNLAVYTLIGIVAQYQVARNDTLHVMAGTADTGYVAGPPAWSPDGRRLLVATGSQPYGWPAPQPPWSLTWVEVDSALWVPRGGYARTFRPVPLDGFGGRPVWPRLSRDGAWIAFAAHPGAGQRGGVYVVPAQGGPVRALAEFPAGGMLTGPEWNAAGDSVYFSSPDPAGVYQLRRVHRGGGAAEALTAGAEHVLHPRLSPDGRTFAVTLLDVRTELWTHPGRVPAVAGPPVPAARGSAAPVRPDEIDAGLLEVVRLAEARPRELRRLWPGFWDGRQAYAVRSGHGETLEALIVAPSGETPAGFAPVDGAGLPAFLRGRLYHARGVAASVDPERLRIPVLPVRAGAARTPAEQRERLRMVFAATFDSVTVGRFALNPYPGCPIHDPRSCAVQAQVERAILQRALQARGGALRELLRDYTALVWTWGGGDTPAALWLARVHGIPAYVAGLAAHVATGTLPAGYHADVAARLAAPQPEPGEWTPAAHGVPGEAIALLLDRVDAGWRERVAAGQPLLDALLSATGLSPAEALVRAPDALRRHGLERMLAELPNPAPPGANPAVSEGFYLAALRTLAPGTRAIHIDFQAERSAADQPSLEYRAGPAGAAVPAPGFVLLPDPAWVRVRLGNVDLDVRGHPVALITTPGITSRSVRVVVYPRVDLTDVVPPRLPDDDRGHHIRAEGIDLRTGDGAEVCRCAEIYIRPAP